MRLRRRILQLTLIGLLAATASASPSAEEGASHRTSSVARLLFHPAHPELHPNLARGSKVGAKYLPIGSHTVNLFNGNLSLNVALGPRFPLSTMAGSYRVLLHYNSEVWNYRTSAGVHTGEPESFSNAGLGFAFSFGRLLAPGTPGNQTGQWMYVSPTGDPHVFYPDLHADTPDVDDGSNAFEYTRDGTYIRLNHTTTATKKLLVWPDGKSQVYWQHGDAFLPTRSQHQYQGGA